MKRKIFFALAFIMLVAACASMLSGCFGVVPCAWVTLDMEGYVRYSTDMYGSVNGHICLWEDAETAQNDTYNANYLLKIQFYPRILGPDSINDTQTTTVDISGEYEMIVTINASIYSDSKHVYLNGEQLTPSSSYDGSVYFKQFTYSNFGLVRGNPNGHINNFINTIEYK